MEEISSVFAVLAGDSSSGVSVPDLGEKRQALPSVAGQLKHRKDLDWWTSLVYGALPRLLCLYRGKLLA